MMRQPHDGAGGHAAIGEVVLLEFRDAGVRPQIPAARDHVRRHPGLEQLRGARRAVGLVVVVAQHHDHVGIFRRVVHHPEAPRQPKQRMPRDVNYGNQRD